MSLSLGALLRQHVGEATAAEISDEALRRLERLDDLVSRWSRAVGLVGFRSREERALRFFAEAIAALPWLPRQGEAVDIGSGGGSPALPLVIVRPAVSWTLVESSERKCAFLEEAVDTLGLDNARVWRGRYQELVLSRKVETVTVRGVALEADGLERLMGYVGASGRLLWFSSEARLLRARGKIPGTTEGPIRLVAGGGCLLVARPERFT